MECNLCGNTIFTDMNSRPGVKCNKCGSLERTRLMGLYLDRIKIKKAYRILHIAPERGLYNYLSTRVHRGNYIPADIDPDRYKFAKDCRKIDLCNLDDMPSSEYDLILHIHVLEHIPCNIAYTLYHLHRMLKNDGSHICIIPFLPGKYDESFQDIGDDERKRRFGQFDHVRRFGCEDINMHLGKLIDVPTEFNATNDFSEDVLREANIPENHWKGFNIGTVLQLRKYDMKLLRKTSGFFGACFK